MVGFCHLLHKNIAKVVVDVCPCVDNLIVTLGVGDETHIICLGDLAYLFITTLHKCFLCLWDDDVVEVERKTCKVCHAITQVLDTVKELAGFCKADSLDNIGDDIAETLL